MAHENILILGIGCTLYADQGFGVSVIQRLQERFRFPDHVHVVDGGLLGIGLTGTIAHADRLIAVDAICNGGAPGDIYRLETDKILERLAGKNHVQHVEFLEALAHCRALDDPPHAVLLGIEPDDTQTVACALSSTLGARVDDMIDCICKELDGLGIVYEKLKH